MSTPFKMKGSPMKRNFGIGASPMKQKPKFDPYTGSVIKEESQKLKEPPKGKRPTKTKKKRTVDPNINPETGLYYPKPGGAEGNKPERPS